MPGWQRSKPRAEADRNHRISFTASPYPRTILIVSGTPKGMKEIIMKKTSIITSIALAGLLALSGVAMARPAGDKGERKSRPVVERETDEMKTLRHKAYDLRVDRIKLAVKDGKIDQARADFILKRMGNEKAFKDANPEWTKYDRRGMRDGRRGGHSSVGRCKNEE